MKSAEQGFVFQPELRIFDAGSHINVVFDSQSPVDAARASRLLRVPKNFKRLSFKLEGFSSPTDEGSRRELAGKIILTYVDDAGSEHAEDLAESRLIFNAPGKPDKHGKFSYVDPNQIEYVLRQALSQVFTGALADYFEQSAGVGSDASSAASQGLVGPYAYEVAPRRRVSRREVQHAVVESAELTARRRKRNTRLAWVLPPVIVIMVLGGMQWLASKQSPIENAVAQQMANDPEAIKAQVNLVNETLRSMNLDPGQGGDLGCLAPQ